MKAILDVVCGVGVGGAGGGSGAGAQLKAIAATNIMAMAVQSFLFIDTPCFWCLNGWRYEITTYYRVPISFYLPG